MTDDHEDETPGTLSRKLTAAFVDAATDLLQQRGGGMVTGIVGLVEIIDADGDTGWATITADHQTPSVDLGMARFLTMSFEHDVERYLNRIEEP